jgi:putative ABC transport system ATP-binding protein
MNWVLANGRSVLPIQHWSVTRYQFLFNQGALSDLIYTVSAGEVEILRQSPGGGHEVLRIAKAGDYFGEIGPVFGLPRSATVRTRTDAAVIGYSVPAFLQRLGAAAGPGLNEGRELALD